VSAELLTGVGKEEDGDDEFGEEKEWELKQNARNFATERIGGLNKGEEE
jgi:hypothetical protein